MGNKEWNLAFSDYIRDKMRERLITQVELSKASGVSQDKISRILNGKHLINIALFVKLGKVLDPMFIENFIKHCCANSKYSVNKSCDNQIDGLGQSKNALQLILPLVYSYSPKTSNGSLQIRPAPTHLQKISQAHSTRDSRKNKLFSSLHLPVRGRAKIAFVKNHNSNRGYLQLQHGMVETDNRFGSGGTGFYKYQKAA